MLHYFLSTQLSSFFSVYSLVEPVLCLDCLKRLQRDVVGLSGYPVLCVWQGTFWTFVEPSIGIDPVGEARDGAGQEEMLYGVVRDILFQF